MTEQKEIGKVSVSDISSKLIYYVATENGWFDGYSKNEIETKAKYMNIDLDWSKVR